MAQFGRFYVPPFSAVVNVVRETAKSLIPDDSPCREMLRKATGADKGPAGQNKSNGQSTKNQHQSGYDDVFESPATGYDVIDGENRPAKVDCEEQQGYQRSGPQKFSIAPGSFDRDSDEFGNGEGGEFKSRHKINEWQAAWNVTNAIQGMFIVSLPFAVLHGGYWAIFAMIGIAYICCYTGKILIECLYEIDLNNGQRVRVRDSYVSIARECFGPVWGSRIVNVAQMIELLMTCILYVVVCGDLMIGTFPDGFVDGRSWMCITGVFLLPLGFVKSLHHVSLLSFWCTMSHLVINAVILGYCLLEIANWGWSKVKFRIDTKNFPISLGVIVFSYTSQIFLPTLEGNMVDRSKFDWMLDWSHIAAAVFKSLFGYLCFLTFQNDTQQVITNNLHSPSFKGMVNFFLYIKALLSYPLPYYAACEILEKNFFKGQPETRFPSIWYLDGDLKVWGLAFKVSVIFCTVLMAISIPHFAILMGFIGSFTGTMLSFIWPCYFHLRLKGNSLQWKTVIFDCFVIFLGSLFGIIGMYDSGSAMIEAFEIGLPF
ncbi:hypothetical protein V9T40_011982 [Parthenolecanium corni]|uniref:Vesicular inhibitory amino acid transporter n=1 Tax=Parthenolecanium corni TaxID=536013 RepID=A0AAN9T821_9HEMI